MRKSLTVNFTKKVPAKQMQKLLESGILAELLTFNRPGKIDRDSFRWFLDRTPEANDDTEYFCYRGFYLGATVYQKVASGRIELDAPYTLTRIYYEKKQPGIIQVNAVRKGREQPSYLSLDYIVNCQNPFEFANIDHLVITLEEFRQWEKLTPHKFVAICRDLTDPSRGYERSVSPFFDKALVLNEKPEDFLRFIAHLYEEARVAFLAELRKLA